MAVFVSAVVGAIATPVAEPMAMFLLMGPLLILYFVAAGIAYLHDKRVAKKLAALELADPQAAEYYSWLTRSSARPSAMPGRG
jgi:Sec-independent protein secretion pathway component TatC